MWKELIREKLKQGIREHAVSKDLADTVRELLKQDREIVLCYNNTREQYMGFFYRDEWFKEKKRNRFSKTTKEALKRFVKAGMKDAIEEMKKRVKNKTW